MIEFQGVAYREGGQWKMRIVLPEWVTSDILRDSEHMERTVILLDDIPVFPAATRWESGKEKAPKVIATAIFTEEGIG